MKVVKRVALEGKTSRISITEEASSVSTKSRRTTAVTVGENCIVKSATDLSTNGDLHEAFELQIEPSQEAHDQSHLQQDVQSILVNRNSSSDNLQC
uniref:Uncharacterized protein n=1 Tax=Nelumbo nucifera TaxID=4432 RepID=A0A822YD30_NELNU|nr:TPA_asm: hypothetical protein HUJ06_028876 [Nelumbo nucifera]